MEVACIKNNDPLYQLQLLPNKAHITGLNKLANVFLSSTAAFTNWAIRRISCALAYMLNKFGRKICRHKQKINGFIDFPMMG